MKLKLIIHFIFLLSIACAAIPASAEEPAKPPAISESGKININIADANLLAQTLIGIGLKKAQAIVEYRESFGPFHNIQELGDVSGIGKSTLAKNAALISIE